MFSFAETFQTIRGEKKLAQNKRDDKHFVTVKTVREKGFNKLKDDDFLDSVRPPLLKRKAADVGIKQQKRKGKEKQTNIVSITIREN